MPLIEIPAHDVIARREERYADMWPRRDGNPSRVEPIARPRFDVPFHLIPGEKIFTIGSCFARHVAGMLSNRGFEIPTLELSKRDDFDPRILNNYGVPSIYQELAWALDPGFPFQPEAGFTEILPGKFVDNQLPQKFRPLPYKEIVERREAIRNATASAKECRVIIITLGLTEVWYDKRFGLYVNEHPRLQTLAREPERFVLRVLSFDETMEYLRRTMDVLRRYGRPDVQVLLTVSPVPMISTHRDVDIMVANTYSKSVLRTAAEHVVSEYDFVHYYPSFESVILSDRQRAWNDDLIHVTQELVDVNVGRMVEAYVGHNPSTIHIESSEELLLHITEVASGPVHEWRLLMDNEDRVSRSFAFAVRFVRVALNRKAFERALDALRKAPAEWKHDQRELLEAEALTGLEQFKAAVDLLMKLRFRQRSTDKLSGDARRYWRLVVAANIGLGEMNAAKDAALVVSKGIRPDARNIAYEMLARGYLRHNLYPEALHFFEQALQFVQTDLLLMDYAEALLKAGRKADALKVIRQTTCHSPSARNQRDWLLTFIDVSGEAQTA